MEKNSSPAFVISRMTEATIQKILDRKLSLELVAINLIELINEQPYKSKVQTFETELRDANDATFCF